MNHHLTLLSLTALLSLPAHAALTAYDGIDYTPGNLKTQNGGAGWGGAWGATGTSTGDLDVVSSSLTYSTLATTGGKVETVAANEAEFRAAAYSTGTIWLGFLAQVNGTDITTANMASVGVFNGASQLTWLAVRQNQVQLYTRNAANTAFDVNTSTSYTNGNTVFLVSRIQFGAGTSGSDLVDYWVNPALGIDLTTTDASHVTTVDGRGVAFDRIRVSGSSTVGAPNYIDELRIGDTYSDVAPIPEPSAALLGGLSLLALLRRRRAH